jgi:hypothetical protein
MLVFSYQNTSAQLENSLFTRLKHSVLKERMPAFDDVPRAQSYRDAFVDISSFTVEGTVRGMDWQPLPINATVKELVSSFQEFLELCGDGSIISKWEDAIFATFDSLATKEEQGAGDPDQDFLANEGSTSNGSTPTSEPLEEESKSLSPA